MTEVLVIRLDKKQMARLTACAKSKSMSRSAFVRQTLEKSLAAETNGKTAKPSPETAAKKKKTPPVDVNWAEHFEWLRKHGRRIEGYPADEIRALDR